MTHVFVNHSVRWPDYPPMDGYIRAHSFQTGNLLTKRSDGMLLIRYLTQSDIKGWIPAYVVGWATSSLAPSLMKKIVTAAKGYEKWLEESGQTSAYERFNPETDSDEFVKYGEEARY